MLKEVKVVSTVRRTAMFAVGIVWSQTQSVRKFDMSLVERVSIEPLSIRSEQPGSSAKNKE